MNAPSRSGPAWLAAVLALLCNGLGHAYAGRPRTGAVVYALWLALEIAFVAALRLGFGAAVAGGAALLAFWSGQAVLAARAVASTAPARRPWLSRPLGLVAFYAASVAATAAVRLPFEAYLPRAFYQSSVSMAPTIRIGDLVLADPRAVIARGAVVVHQAPPGGRSGDPLVKRVVGVAGDVVELRDGRLVLNGIPVEREAVPGPCATWTRTPDGIWREDACAEFAERLDGRAYHTYCTPGLACGDAGPFEVPPGHVFVLGDRRDRSADSRVYGPIAEDALLGGVTYVYFSLGPAGVEWGRLGWDVR